MSHDEKHDLRGKLPDESRQCKWDRRFLRLLSAEMAHETDGWSKDPSTKCGAIVVSDRDRIVSTGYNGFPDKLADTAKRLENRELKYKYTIHAEINALHEALCDVRGFTMYVYPLPPCAECSLHIIQRGIARVVTVEPTEDIKSRWASSNVDALDNFREAGVEVVIYDSSILSPKTL